MLQSLYLNGNRITCMDDNYMATGSFYLHGNQLTSPPDLYSMKLVSFALRGNPLVCDRVVCWIRMWPFNKILPSLDEFYCISPSTLNGSLVLDVHPLMLGCYEGRSYEYHMVISMIKSITKSLSYKSMFKSMFCTISTILYLYRPPRNAVKIRKRSMQPYFREYYLTN